MAQHPNHQDTVQQIRDQVTGAGIDLNHGPGECGRFEITKRVAFALKNEGFGLIAKFSGQNLCADGSLGHTEDGFAVDAIMDHDGVVIDILGTNNVAQWFVQPTLANPDLWRAPFPVDVVPTPTPEPTPPPTSDLEARVAALEQAALDFGQVAKVFDDRLRSVEARPVYTKCQVRVFGINFTGILLP